VFLLSRMLKQAAEYLVLHVSCRPLQQCAAGLLLWAQWTGDIYWLWLGAQKHWRRARHTAANVSSVTLSAGVGSWTQTCLLCNALPHRLLSLTSQTDIVLWHSAVILWLTNVHTYVCRYWIQLNWIPLTIAAGVKLRPLIQPAQVLDPFTVRLLVFCYEHRSR